MDTPAGLTAVLHWSDAGAASWSDVGVAVGELGLELATTPWRQTLRQLLEAVE